MRKWGKIVLITGGIVIIFLVLLLFGLSLYINANKAIFLKQITSILNDHLDGKVYITDMKPSLLRSFPNASIGLEKVVLQDSRWHTHNHDLLNARYIYVQLNTLSLLRRHVDIVNVTLQNAIIYLYTDNNGYSNTDILKKQPAGTMNTSINQVTLKNTRFIIENRQKFKLFQLEVQHLDGKLKAMGNILQANVIAEIFSKEFAFNTVKGSYLKNKKLQLHLSLQFNKDTKILHVPQQEIKIDNHPLLIAGQFYFGEKPPKFHLNITAKQVLLKQVASWLSPNISTKLSSIQLIKPLDAAAILNGHLKYRDTPTVLVTWKTNGNILESKLGTWADCSFTGRFNNEVVAGKGHSDENAAIHIYKLAATVAHVPLEADTIKVVNLKNPLLHGHFRSDFSLSNLNEGFEGLPVMFKAGNAKADLNYTGPVLQDDSTASSLQGVVQVQQGEFTYLPRNLSFHHANATLRFTGQDLLLENISIRSDKSSLQMDGAVKNLLNMYFTTPEKIELDWNVRSPLVDLNEFKSFLTPRKKTISFSRQQSVKMSQVSKQLDKVLSACNVKMRVQLDKVVFQRFTAGNVKALLGLTETDLLFNQIALQHAGGQIQVTGNIHQQGNNNLFQLNTTVSNIQIKQFFYAFNNFGLTALTSDNLRGNVSASVNLKGNVLDDGTLATNSLSGTVNFKLKNGALLKFAPLADIGNFIFRRRRLDSITFDNLSNTLKIAGSKIIIPPMRIASSAVNIDVSGVYGIDGGTDINLAIPLRNPAKDAAVVNEEERRKRSRKGFILHLHAVSGKDGKVKFKVGKGSQE